MASDIQIRDFCQQILKTLPFFAFQLKMSKFGSLKNKLYLSAFWFCSDIEEVLCRANDTEYGLAAGVFSRDIYKVRIFSFSGQIYHQESATLVLNGVIFLVCDNISMTGSACSEKFASWNSFYKYLSENRCCIAVRWIQAVRLWQRLRSSSTIVCQFNFS